MIAVLALCVFQGCRRGFILTLCGLLAVFVAFIGATVVSNALAGPVARLIQPIIHTRIEQVLEESIRRAEYIGPSGGVAEVPDELPLSGVLDALQNSDVYRSLAEAFQNAVDSGAAKVTASAAQSLAGYAARELARSALFLISFAVVLLAWLLLAHALDLVARLPVLSDINRVLGGAFGFLKGILILSIAAWLMKGRLIPQETVDQTFILKFFCQNGPLSVLAALSSGTIPALYS